VRLENTFIGAEEVGTTTERRLWEAGITHWDAYDPSVVGGATGDRLATHISEARDRLDARDARYFDRRLPRESRWRLYENFREEACFFDIETTGLDRHTDVVTTVSFHQGGSTETLVRGRDLTADRVADRFAAAPVLVTYNGHRFDIPFLETALDIEIATPHLDAMWPCHRLDLYGGLDGARSAVGIDRAGPDIGGAEAVRLWHAAERGEDGALETLIRYNQEDAAILEALLDRVTARLHDRVFPA